MAYDAGALVAKLQLDAKQFSAGMDKSVAQMGKMDTHSAKLSKTTKGLAIAMVASAAAMTAGIIKLGTSAFRTAAMFETFVFQLRAISTSREEAVRSMEMIRKFAERTPFFTDQVVQAFVQLKAVGIDATESMMTTIGNVAFTMDRDIRDVASGLISFETEVLRRLGIQIDRTGQRVKIMSGTIRIETDKSAEAIRRGLLDVWEQRFPDAMEKAESTWKGLHAIMASGWQEFQATLGDAILPTMKDLLKDTVIPLVNQMREWIQANKDLIATHFDAIMSDWISKIKSLGKALFIVLTHLGKLYEEYLIPPTQAEQMKKRIREIRENISGLYKNLAEAREELEYFTRVEPMGSQVQWVRQLRLEVDEWRKALAHQKEQLVIWEAALINAVYPMKEMQKVADEIAESIPKTTEALDYQTQVWIEGAKAVEQYSDWLETTLTYEKALKKWIAEGTDEIIDRYETFRKQSEEIGKLALLEPIVETTEQASEVWDTALGRMSDTFSDVFAKRLTGEIDSMGDMFNNFTRSLVDAWATMIADMIAKDITGSLFGKKGEGGGFFDFIGGIIGGIGGWFKGTKQTGGPVGETGLYGLHEGEYVVPKAKTRKEYESAEYQRARWLAMQRGPSRATYEAGYRWMPPQRMRKEMAETIPVPEELLPAYWFSQQLAQMLATPWLTGKELGTLTTTGGIKDLIAKGIPQPGTREWIEWTTKPGYWRDMFGGRTGAGWITGVSGQKGQGLPWSDWGAAAGAISPLGPVGALFGGLVGGIIGKALGIGDGGRPSGAPGRGGGPDFQYGGEVPFTGYGHLHKGEFVVDRPTVDEIVRKRISGEETVGGVSEITINVENLFAKDIHALVDEIMEENYLTERGRFKSLVMGQNAERLNLSPARRPE